MLALGNVIRMGAGVEKVAIGDFDHARGRVRARAATTKTRTALWTELPPALAEAIERTLPPATTATSLPRSSRA